MKKYFLLPAICSVFLFSVQEIAAQDTEIDTAEFHVKGVCSQCKARIENAAYIKGVKFCEWNIETGMLSVIYKPEKVELAEIHKSIAQAGHTTDMLPADQDAYNKLPSCCAYNNEGVHKH